jgi:MFS family permease
MVKHLFFGKMGISPKAVLVNIILIVNVFAWYSCAVAFLKTTMDAVAFTFSETSMVYICSFGAAVISIILGGLLVNKFDRERLLLSWTMLGIVCSVVPIFLDVTNPTNALVVSVMFSFSFGLGVPASMAFFAGSTVPENRARFGSIVLVSMFLGTFMLKSLITLNIVTDSIVLASWRGLSLFAIPLISHEGKSIKRDAGSSLISITRERYFIPYFIPWTLFSLINYLGWPISARIHGEEIIRFSGTIEIIISGVFAIIAGFVSDSLGRKRTLMSGFILFGLGYAALGIYPSNMFAWYFYTVVDGLAWGIIGVIFLFTIWGDLARDKPSEKYYAIGILPYSLSNFLRVTVGPFFAEMISPYAIFSFAAFLLFLAVLPLMYAPETLPEKRIRERELKIYVEKAKKVKEKYA